MFMIVRYEPIWSGFNCLRHNQPVRRVFNPFSGKFHCFLTSRRGYLDSSDIYQ